MMMRLSDEFQALTEQLTELYQYRAFIDERIATLEFRLKDFGDMLDFMDNLEEGILKEIEKD